jgi:hypothetical protein
LVLSSKNETGGSLDAEKTIHFFFTSQLLRCFDALQSSAPAAADTAGSGNVTFTLHKLLFKNGEVPDEVLNDGYAAIRLLTKRC